MLPLLDMYNSIFSTSSIDKLLLKTQMEIAKIELQEDFSYNNLKSVIALSKYPLFYKLLQFSLTIPTSSVKSERSISALRRVFNYNRTTMGLIRLNRLEQMSLLAIESDILESITDVIDSFASLKSRKLSLV